MIGLERYLEKFMDGSIKDSQINIKQQRKSLRALEKIDLDNARYTVALNSLWANEGEKNLKLSRRGTLEDAIKIAEKKFKKLNNRSDVQAQYFVTLKIGDVPYWVPREYWEKYAEKH